jgi:hypothetical protein
MSGRSRRGAALVVAGVLEHQEVGLLLGDACLRVQPSNASLWDRVSTMFPILSLSPGLIMTSAQGGARLTVSRRLSPAAPAAS